MALAHIPYTESWGLSLAGLKSLESVDSKSLVAMNIACWHCGMLNALIPQQI